jgi:hypothetical protein
MSAVEFVKIERGSDVLVRGRRVPFLEAHQHTAGRTTLVFDRRLGLDLDARNYETVTAFLADVIEALLDPNCGRTFPRVMGIESVETDAS